jgi:hypothetical protein
MTRRSVRGQRELFDIYEHVDAEALGLPPVKRPPRSFTYYLGSRPNWLDAPHLVKRDVPLFVSATTLARYRTRGDAFPVRRWGNWALDSGAYTALTTGNENHPWHRHADDYGGLVTRLMEDLGTPDFAAPQDWPCEETVRGGTGMTTKWHIDATVDNFLYLREEFGHVPWIPVLQGDEPEDYLYCESRYLDAGVDLAEHYRVGVGSICRRAHVPGIVEVLRLFADRGYRLHAFGVKITALPVIGDLLWSADSYAWSDTARLDRYMMPGCDHRSKPDKATGDTLPTDCRNCPRWAQQWRRQVLASMSSAALAA